MLKIDNLHARVASKDILKGLSAVDFRADAVPESVKPAVTGEGAADGDAPGGTQDQDSGGASRQ